MAKKIRNILICIMLLSCDSTQPTTEVFDSGRPLVSDAASGIYVCYNPSSDEHGKLCSERCLINPRAFCWLLERESCNADISYQWQEENCHFFD